MGNNSDFQQQVLALLTKLKAKKEALQKEFQDRITEVDREIESVSTTVRLLREPPTNIEVRVGDSFAVRDGAIVSQLMGKTMRQALVIIATANSGVVRIKDVKPLLIGAGIIKKPKFAWGAIFTNLTRGDEFEKVPNQPGTFRLVDNPAQSKLSVAS